MELIWISPMQEAADETSDRRRAILGITLLGSLVDGVLGVLKLATGILAGSQALVADGVHSLSDLASDAGVMVMAWFGTQGPDANHPHGHGRIETLGTMLLGTLLLLVAGAVGYDALIRLLQGEHSIPAWPALVIALVSIGAKEWVYRRTRKVARRVDSSMLLANAWHSRSDALSSVAVLVGVAGAMLGWPWLDLLGALAVAGLIAWIGWKLLWDAVRELIDTGLPADARARVEAIAEAVPGVRAVRRLRSRTVNADALLELDLVVSPDISVSEAHQLSLVVSHRLRESELGVKRVQIHVDPEGTQHDPDLPLRDEVLATLSDLWHEQLGAVRHRLQLHYHPGGIEVDLLLLEPCKTLSQSALTQASAHLPWLTTVRVWRPASS